MAATIDMDKVGYKQGSQDAERGKGRRYDLVVEPIEFDVEHGEVKGKIIGGPPELVGTVMDFSIREPGEEFPGSSYQGNRIDDRFVQAAEERPYLIVQQAIVYPGAKEAKCRWIKLVGSLDVEVNGEKIPKVVWGPLTVTGFKNKKTGKQRIDGVQVWDRELVSLEDKGKVEEIKKRLNASNAYYYENIRKYQEDKKGLPVRETIGFALFALNEKGEVVGQAPGQVNHRSPAFRAIAEGIKDEKARVQYLFSPPTGEDFEAFAEALKNKMASLGYENVKIVAATCRNYPPSRANESAFERVAYLSQMAAPLYVDKDGQPVVSPYQTPSMACVHGIVALSPGKVKVVKGQATVVGQDSNWANEAYASSRVEMLPQALGLSVAPELKKAFEVLQESRREKMAHSADSVVRSEGQDVDSPPIEVYADETNRIDEQLAAELDVVPQERTSSGPSF